MANRRPLKAAIIGAGWIAEHCHLPGYRRAEIEVAAIADIVPQQAAKQAAAFGVARTYTDWRQLLKEERPDIVSVCVPNMFHAEVALGALKAGAHVLCEKPLATSVAQAAEMFDTARRQGVLLMAGQSQRFRPNNDAIKERVDAGDLGDVYHTEAVYIRRLGIPTWGTFTQSSYAYGGALCDIGVHSLDLAVWFMGNPRPVSVSAATERRFGDRPDLGALRGEWDSQKYAAEDYGALQGVWDAAAFDVEDFATAFVRFENGATLYLQAAWASHIEHRRQYVKLLGTDGGAITDPPSVHRLEGGMPADEVLSVPRSTGWEAEVCHFVDAVRGETPLLVREEETMNVQRILNAAYESAALRHEVQISG